MTLNMRMNAKGTSMDLKIVRELCVCMYVCLYVYTRESASLTHVVCCRDRYSCVRLISLVKFSDNLSQAVSVESC
jgi:hypothetical protein